MADRGSADFIARVREDQAFRAEVFAAEVGEDRLAFVNGEGYDLTAKELVDATSELGDDELDRVQGGSPKGWLSGSPDGVFGAPLDGC
jgi:predicted ribosomally synthesized peptide with nif11-like leader